MPAGESLEFVIRSITDHGRLLTLTLQQEIRTEPVDQAELLRQKIDSISGLDDDTREVMKKIIPALLATQLPQQATAYSPIQMNITVTRQIYERLGAPKVGETLQVGLSRS